MRRLLNILWFIFGGFISGTLWILAGAIMVLTIVGIPWAPAAFRMAGFSYWPFGRIVVERDNGPDAGRQGRGPGLKAGVTRRPGSV